MKRVLAVALVGLLILGLPAVAMAGNGNGKANGKAQIRSTEDSQNGNAVKNAHMPMGGANSAKPGSQGSVHCRLVIDSTGAAILTAARGSHVETFEASIPAGLTEEEALGLLGETFGVAIEEAFGLEINCLKLKGFYIDEEAGTTVVTLLAIHGETPVEGEDEEEVEDPEDPEDSEDESDDESDEETDDESDEEEDDSTTDL